MWTAKFKAIIEERDNKVMDLWIEKCSPILDANENLIQDLLKIGKKDPTFEVTIPYSSILEPGLDMLDSIAKRLSDKYGVLIGIKPVNLSTNWTLRFFITVK